jgi:hypothetical protein
VAHEFVIEREAYSEIKRHLLRSKEEQAAFVFAEVVTEDAEIRFTAVDYYLARPDDFEYQSGYHITLTDEALARVIKMAWDRQSALVELHSHPDSRFPIGFSPSDMSGFEQMVPHVRWRLSGKPYLAIVVGPEGFDALVWKGDGTAPEPLARMVVGMQTRRPSGLSLRRMRGSGWT